MLKTLKKSSGLIVLGIILAAAFYVRQYKIDRPIADWHSWRQADTAAVARNFVKEGFNPFVPKFDDMSTTASGRDNPNRYRYVEFPIYASVVYLFYSIFQSTDETIARQVNVGFALISIVFIYLLVKRFAGRLTALFSAFFYAFIPYNIFFTTTTLPDVSMVTFSLAALYLFPLWFDKLDQTKSRILYGTFAAVALTAAILSKPIAVFILIPITFVAYLKFGLSLKRAKIFILFITLSLLPFLIWRYLISPMHPEGIPASGWLLNGDGIRFRPSFFRWMIAERLGKEILSVVGFGLFLIGVFIKPEKIQHYFFHFYLVGIALYVIVFATGNVRHDYYQIPLVPVLSIFMAIGVAYILKLYKNTLGQVISSMTVVFLIALTFFFGWYEVRYFFSINNGAIIEAGDWVDRNLPKDAKVIAPYNGDTAFLYKTNRYGWPVVDRGISDLIQAGATHFVSVNFGDPDLIKIRDQYQVVHKTDIWIVLDLTKPLK
ncbi:MAG TPA: glycosyltransferase family 39 protein [Patescibacteria group bacterium]